MVRTCGPRLSWYNICVGVDPYNLHREAGRAAHLPRLLLLRAGGLCLQAAEQVQGEHAVLRGDCEGALLVQGK